MSRVFREYPSTDTWSIWKYSTAAAPAPSPTLEGRALKAAAREQAARVTVPAARAAARAAVRAAVRAAARAAVRAAVTYDETRGGARLVMGYDAPSNSFNGIVENTTGGTLSNVRIEVHLSNGVELGPTTPVDMRPGEMYAIRMPATQESFTGWIVHAEVGYGEGGGEHGSAGSGEAGGEHGGGRESGGEHGGRGEQRGGG